MITLKPAVAAVAGLHGCAWIEVIDLVPLRELAARGVVRARDARVQVRRVGAAAGLEHEPVHPRELAQRLLEAADDLEDPLQRLLVLVRMQLGDERAAVIASLTRGLYFIVQVPKRLMPIIPSVSCERCR